MKAIYKTQNNRIAFEVEGENVKALFRELSAIQEIFDAEKQCGVCRGTEIRLLARKVDDYEYFELGCLTPGCRARFAFGQARKGGNLFPKRRGEDGTWLDNGGWSKYDPLAVPQQTQAEPAPPQQNRPQPVAAPSQVRPQQAQRPVQPIAQPAQPQHNRATNQGWPSDAEYAGTSDDVPFR